MGWAEQLSAKREEMLLAEKNGNASLVAKLRDEHTELECMDACIRIIRDGGPLDHYTEIAKRAEHISPWFSKALLKSVAKYKNLPDRPNNYEKELQALEKEIHRAEKNGNASLVAKLRDEHTELECMDACIRIIRDGGPLDHYTEIAKRAEHISPWFSKALLKSVARKQNLSNPLS